MAATVNRVSPTELRTLDAKLHQQEILNIFRRLKRVGAKSIFELKMIVTKGTTPTTLGFDYKPEGLRFIRSQNVLNNELTGDYLYIDADCNEAMKRSIVKKGDVLTNIVGASIGRTAVYDYEDKANTNQAVAIIKSNNSVDSHYLSTWMNSNLCLKVIAAQQSGNARDNFDLEQVREIEVPLPDSLVQIYIGDKVRQAEQLRAWAKRLRISVDKQLDGLNFPITNQPGLLNRVSAQLMADRLDPRPYRSHYLNLVSEIEKLPHDKISSVVLLLSGCPVSSKDFIENGGVPLVRIRNIGFDDFIGLDTGVSHEVFQDAIKYHAKKYMVVVGMDGIFRAQFFVDDELPMLVNQRVAMLIPQHIRGELLTHWLNRPEGQMQLNQWAVKTTVEHTSLADIGRVLIPRLDEVVENSLADALYKARLGYRFAKFLTQTAKSIVEALIEGQLTEQELIQAQQGLEDGDTSLDQAILSKLSAEGYAIEGASPLFSDLDTLYNLLAQSAAGGEE